MVRCCNLYICVHFIRNHVFFKFFSLAFLWKSFPGQCEQHSHSYAACSMGIVLPPYIHQLRTLHYVLLKRRSFNVSASQLFVKNCNISRVSSPSSSQAGFNGTLQNHSKHCTLQYKMSSQESGFIGSSEAFLTKDKAMEHNFGYSGRNIPHFTVYNILEHIPWTPNFKTTIRRKLSKLWKMDSGACCALSAAFTALCTCSPFGLAA